MKKIVKILESDWTGAILTLLESLGEAVVKIVSFPFLLGAKLLDKLVS